MNEESRIRIAVFCVQSSYATVRKTFAYNFPEWEVLDEIVVIPIPDHWRGIKPFVRKKIDEAVPKQSGFVQLIILDALEWSGQIGGGDDSRQIIRYASLDEFGKKLPAVLRGVGLDWLTHTEQKLSKWRHGTVDKKHISAWLWQFDQLGSHRWVGEGLLKVINFWPEDKLIASVGFTTEALADFDRVCFHGQQQGKSAGALANIFAKQIKPLNPKFPSIEDFYTVLTDDKYPSGNGNILFMEDGLFSGTEMTKIFGGLLGLKSAEGRKQKIAELPNASLLRDKKIMLLFPVATSFGVVRLNDFLLANNLPNVQVNPCAQGLIEVLTDLGKEALKAGCFFDPEIQNCPVNPDAHFMKIPFENLAVWKNASTARRAATFCREIGGQLFRQYLQTQGWEWHELRIQRCSMGMYGLGLAFAFAHSVPKASLPLLWAAGKVQFGKRVLDWSPLFPNAA